MILATREWSLQSCRAATALAMATGAGSFAEEVGRSVFSHSLRQW